MTRLAKVADGQVRTDKEFDDVDYDVWACQSCGNVLKLRFGTIFTEYRQCPGCAAATKSSTTKTLAHATEDSHGEVLVTETCPNCDYRYEETRVTPMLDEPTHNDSSPLRTADRSTNG